MCFPCVLQDEIMRLLLICVTATMWQSHGLRHLYVICVFWHSEQSTWLLCAHVISRTLFQVTVFWGFVYASDAPWDKCSLCLADYNRIQLELFNGIFEVLYLIKRKDLKQLVQIMVQTKFWCICSSDISKMCWSSFPFHFSSKMCTHVCSSYSLSGIKIYPRSSLDVFYAWVKSWFLITNYM